MRYRNGQELAPFTFNNSTKSFATFEVLGQVCIGITADLAGSSIAGTAFLEASSDNVKWGTIANSPHTIAGPELYQWNLQYYGFPFIRVSVTSSNTNPMTVTVKSYAKGV